ncbi:MAG: hypothetical protein J6R92_00350 [Akkermansia sp.]|nr:hypothetical protein [Akkermansia sp.]
MNTAAAILMFLLGSGGLALTLFTSLRKHSRAVELGIVCVLLMLVPTAAADSVPVRIVLGCICFVLLALPVGYWLNFTPKGRRCTRKNRKRR